MGKVKLNLCALCLVSLTAGGAVAGVDSPPNRNIRRQAQELLAREMAESWNHEK